MRPIPAIFASIIILLSACSEKHDNRQRSDDQLKAPFATTLPIDVDLDSLASKMVASRVDYADGVLSDAEEIFIKKLRGNLEKPESLRTNYSALHKYNIQVLTSDDGLLKIFYWLSPYSGTMWHVQNIIQYQTPKDSLSTISFESLYEHQKDEGSPTPFFHHVYLLKPASKPMYLLLGNGQMSGMEPYAVCRVLSWENGHFNINAKVFKEATKLQSELFTPASLLDEKNPDSIRQLLKPEFNPSSKTLSYGEAKDTKQGTVFTGKRKSLVFKDGIFQ